MAYRRKQGAARSPTFEDPGSPGDERPPSLAAQAIRASAAHRDASSLSSAYADAAIASHSSHHKKDKPFSPPSESNTYEYTSIKSLNDSKYGFWGNLARKAKSILDDENPGRRSDDRPRYQPPALNTATDGRFHRFSQSPDGFLKSDSQTPHKGSEAIASSLNLIGGTIKHAFEEGMTMVENKTADIIQETRKLHIRRKGSGNMTNNATVLSPIQTDDDTQLKASRDVANAMAAKAKLLLRELKTVKADLAFAKQRCAQLEEENKILRESHVTGDNPEDDDLIRLQLETLLAEKARLAHENSVYTRENRFLREVVEYHQLTMQDVVYVDEGMEEVTEVAYSASATLPSPSSRSASEANSPAVSAPPTPNPNKGGGLLSHFNAAAAASEGAPLDPTPSSPPRHIAEGT